MMGLWCASPHGSRPHRLERVQQRRAVPSARVLPPKCWCRRCDYLYAAAHQLGNLTMSSRTYQQWWAATEVLAAHLFLRAPVRLARKVLRVTKRFITGGRLRSPPSPN
jgi:hypothetical protein